MSKIMDDRLKKEAVIIRKMEAYQFALKLLNRGKDTFSEIVNLTGLTLEEVQEIAEENNIVTS